MLENSMGVPQNIENKTVIDPGISLLGIYLKGKKKQQQHTHTHTNKENYKYTSVHGTITYNSLKLE